MNEESGRFHRIDTRRAERYRDLGLWPQLTICDLVMKGSDEHPDKVAAADSYRCLNYRQLDERVRQATANFVSAGIRPEDRVVLQLPNSVTWLESFLGLILARAVPVMAVDSLRGQELARLIQASQAEHLVTTAPSADGVGEVLCKAGLKAQELVAAQSGVQVNRHEIPITTGSHESQAHDPAALPDPKDLAVIQPGGARCPETLLVGRTHEDYLCLVELSNKACGVSQDTVMLVGLPAAHNYSMTSPGLLGALMAGGAVVFAADPSTSTCLPLLSKYSVTHLPIVPSLLEAWIAAAAEPPGQLASLQRVWVGGAQMDLDLARRAQQELGADIQEVYGMAEGLVCYSPMGMDRTKEQGHHLVALSTWDEIRILPIEGGIISERDRTVGELLTRGPYTVANYLGQAGQGIFDDEGWYHSGDIVMAHRPAEADPRNRLSVIGRIKEQINRGGEKIFPGDIEANLISHPQVKSAEVTASPDPLLGESTRARVRVVPDEQGRYPKTLMLRRYLNSLSVAAYAIPDFFEIECCDPGEPKTDSPEG